MTQLLNKREARKYVWLNPTAVICLQTKKVYTSPFAATRQLRLPANSVSRMVHGERTTPIRGKTFQFVTVYYDIYY